MRAAAPLAELSGPQSAPGREAPAAAAGAGTAVSRWFSSASRGTVSVGDGTVSNAEPTRAGPPRQSSPVPSAPPLGGNRGLDLGGNQARLADREHYRRDHHRPQQQLHRDPPDSLGRSSAGGACGVTAPAPMASSFIDLGVGRGFKDSNGSVAGGGGGGAPCGEKEKGDLRYRGRRRQGGRVQESCISEGSEAAVAAAASEGIEGEGGEDEEDDADDEKTGMEDSWEVRKKRKRSFVFTFSESWGGGGGFENLNTPVRLSSLFCAKGGRENAGGTAWVN